MGCGINIYTIDVQLKEKIARGIEVPKRVSKKETVHLPTITCVCGAEILLIPDVKLMSKALQDHVDEHTRKLKNPKEAKLEAETIMDDLVTKVLQKASET